MNATYELLPRPKYAAVGYKVETLRLDGLPAADLEFLDRLSEEANSGANYFDLLRKVKGPGSVPLNGGEFITPDTCCSVLYRVAHDIADRVGIEQGYVLGPIKESQS